MTATFTTGDNNFGTAKFIVDATAGLGTHTTIASALTAASSGQTIFIRPGTYTENLTLKAGVNITAYSADGLGKDGTAGNVVIIGKATATFAGTANISGICLKTNSDFFLVVSGNSATVIHLFNCILDCNNNTGISYTSSSGSSVINCYYCIAQYDTTGIALHSSSGSGSLRYYNCVCNNTGVATTAASNSAGTILFTQCTMAIALSTSSTGIINIFNSNIDCSGINTSCVVTAGTGSATIFNSYLASGTATAISAGTGTTISAYSCVVNSSNTNALGGAGTLNSAGISYSGTSVKNNATTQTGGIAQGGVTQAPSAGFIGEQLTANASSVATTSAAQKTITSVTLTPGIWDISGSAGATPTGGAALMQVMVCGISATTNVISGTYGINYSQVNLTTGALTMIPPITRVTLTANTTYYLVVQNNYTSTTCPTNAIITGTRVG